MAWARIATAEAEAWVGVRGGELGGSESGLLEEAMLVAPPSVGGAGKEKNEFEAENASGVD